MFSLKKLCIGFINAKTHKGLKTCGATFYFMTGWILNIGFKSIDMTCVTVLLMFFYFTIFIFFSVYIHNVNFIFNMTKYVKFINSCFFIFILHKFKLRVLKGMISKFQWLDFKICFWVPLLLFLFCFLKYTYRLERYF